MHDKQKKILLYLKSHPQAMYEDIAKEIENKSTGVVAHHVKALMANGYLKRINRWQVTRSGGMVLEKE